MGDATAEFFDELARRGREPLLEKATGTLRFDLVDGKRIERWRVAIEKGDVTVSRKNAAADCVVRTEKSVFESLARGELQMLTAFLRGLMRLEGEGELLVLFQRVFPGPPTSRDKRRVAGSARRKR
ncbi:MAG TPA: SCP2 sterol-binding domain-containing protein [Gaiellaceae bacterium]|nr:SCP2 sterol-binding domain-containing protein [Gaiellaceae bacterium]